MKHFVNFSGGAGSWYTARRVIDAHTQTGDELHLVFADTKMEDEDLYRFLDEAVRDITDWGKASDVEVFYHRLADGRDVWEVFNDVKFLGNTRIDPCSKVLKRDLIRKFLEENFPIEETTVYIGIDWTEVHRYEKAKPYWLPYNVQAPLCDAPYLDKGQVLAEMEKVGIKPPRLYAMGFPHNNCGGFCVKAGQGAFKLLLEKMPERYAYHEQKEQEFRDRLGKDVAILRDRTGGTTKPLTLLQLRKRIEGDEEVDEFDLGGCACFTPDNDSDVMLTISTPGEASE